MMTLPPGFSVTDLVTDYSDFAVPFVAVGVLMCCAFIIFRIFKKAL